MKKSEHRCLDKERIAKLCEVLGESQKEVWTFLYTNEHISEHIFNKNKDHDGSSKHWVAPKLLQQIAAYYQKRVQDEWPERKLKVSTNWLIDASDVNPKLEELFRNPPSFAALPEAARAFDSDDLGIQCFSNQADAVDHVKRRLRTRQVKYEEAAVIDFTHHTTGQFVRELARSVKVTYVLGTQLQALRLEAQHQAFLMGGWSAWEAGDLVKTGNLDRLHYDVPPSLRGFLLKDVVVCCGWQVFIPTFQRPSTIARGKARSEVAADAEFSSLHAFAKSEFEKLICQTCPPTTDPVHKYGDVLPHLVVWNEPSTAAMFQGLAKMFEVFINFTKAQKAFDELGNNNFAELQDIKDPVSDKVRRIPFSATWFSTSVSEPVKHKSATSRKKPRPSKADTRARSRKSKRSGRR